MHFIALCDCCSLYAASFQHNLASDLYTPSPTPHSHLPCPSPGVLHSCKREILPRSGLCMSATSLPITSQVMLAYYMCCGPACTYSGICMRCPPRVALHRPKQCRAIRAAVLMYMSAFAGTGSVKHNVPSMPQIYNTVILASAHRN